MQKSKLRERILKILIPIVLAISIIGIFVIVNADNTISYLVEVIDPNDENTDAVDNGEIKIQKYIKKDRNSQPYYDNKNITFELTASNANEVVTPEIAIVFDSSNSMVVNDSTDALKAKAIETVTAIGSNCPGAVMQLFSAKGQKVGRTTNATTIKNGINSLAVGEGSDINDGINAAMTSFPSGNNIQKYIIVFTDATDNAKIAIQDVGRNDIRLFSVLIDNIVSTGFVDNSKPITGKLGMVYSNLIDDENKLYNEYNIETLTNIINQSLNNVKIVDTLTDGIKDYFDFELITTSEKDNIEETETGIIWNISKIRQNETKTLRYKLKMKENIKITNSGHLYTAFYVSDNISVTYNMDTYENDYVSEETFNIRKEHSPIIKIFDRYSITLKAVSEENDSVVLEGVNFNVIIKDSSEPQNIVYTGTITTNAKGEAVIDDLMTPGKINVQIIPSINKLGYDTTDRIELEIESNERGREFEVLTSEWNRESGKSDINENTRNIDIKIPINTQKFEIVLNATQLNNSNVALSNTTFRLIQPKLNNKYEMQAKYGTTNEDGLLVFTPTIMTTAGTYEYILSQMDAPSGYTSIGNATLKITFDNNGNIVPNGVKVYYNDNVTGERVNSGRCDIHVANATDMEDCFGFELNLREENNSNVFIDNAIYDIKVIRTSNGREIETEYKSLMTNDKGKITMDFPGSGYIQLKIKQIGSNITHKPDMSEKTITLLRQDGKVQEIKQAHDDAGKIIDVKAYPEYNKLVINLTNEIRTERNIVEIKLQDSEENDIAIPNARVRLTKVPLSAGEISEIHEERTDFDGIARFQIATQSIGNYLYKIEVVSDLPYYYKDISQEYISVEFDANDNIVDISDATPDETYSFITDTGSVEIIQTEDGFADHVGRVVLGAEISEENTYYFRLRLTGRDTNAPQEGALYEINITSGNTNRTIKRRTNSDGIIETMLILSEEMQIQIAQKESITRYKADFEEKELNLKYVNNTLSFVGGTVSGSSIQGNRVVFEHKNERMSGDDVYLNWTIGKTDKMTGAAACNYPIKIYQVSGGAKIAITEDSRQSILQTDPSASISEEAEPFEVKLKTNSLGEVRIEDLKVKGLSMQKGSEASADIIIVDLDPDDNEKAETIVKYHLAFRYNDYKEAIELTNVETVLGKRLELNKETSGNIDSKGYHADVITELCANYEEVGNLSIDLHKYDVNDYGTPDAEQLIGSVYDIQIIKPDGTSLKMQKEVSEDVIELEGVNVPEDTEIIITEKREPIGYQIDEKQKRILVKNIDQTGVITLELDKGNLNEKSELRLINSVQTSTGTTKTFYDLDLVDEQISTFGILIRAFDKETSKPIPGYSFKVTSSKGAICSPFNPTNETDDAGETKTLVGPQYKEGTVVEYTIEAATPASYYKTFTPVKLLVEFDEDGNPKNISQANQGNYGNPSNGGIWEAVFNTQAWGINNTYAEVMIYIEQANPLVFEIETINISTGEKVTTTEYEITPSVVLEGKGELDSNTQNTIVKVGYPKVLDRGEYTLKINHSNQLGVEKFEPIQNQLIRFMYDADGMPIIYDSNNNVVANTTENVEIISANGLNIKLRVYVNPNVKISVTTDDRITGEELIGETVVTDNGTTNNFIKYKISGNNSESDSGETNSIIKPGYVEPNDNRTVTYRIETISSIYLDRYEPIDETIDVTYENGKVTNVVSNTPNIEIISFENENISIKIHMEPRQALVIENTNFFTGEELSNAEFNIVSELDTSRTATLVVNGGKGIAYVSKLGEANTTVKYYISQTVAGEGPAVDGLSEPDTFAKLKDFEIDITYGANREITNVVATNNDNDIWLTVDKIQPCEPTDYGYNGNDKGIIKLSIASYYDFKINVFNYDRLDTSKATVISGTNYYAESEIQTSGTAITNTDGIGNIHLDRTELNTTVVYTIQETAPSIDYQKLEESEIKLQVEFDENGFLKGSPRIILGNEHASISSEYRQVATDDNHKKFVVPIEINNIPKTRFAITNVDRKDETKGLYGTEYSITSSIGNSIENIPTKEDGTTTIRVDGNTMGKDVVYTIHEDKSSEEYQDLEKDIKIRIVYNQDGTINTATLVDGDEYATANKRVQVNITFDRLTVDVKITNNPAFKINITNIERSYRTPIVGTEYKVVLNNNNSVLSLTDTAGKTTFKAKRTEKNQLVTYEIHQIKENGNYQELEQPIKVAVFFNSDGTIDMSRTSISQGGNFTELTKGTRNDFELDLNIISNVKTNIKINNIYTHKDAFGNVELDDNGNPIVDYIQGTQYYIRAYDTTNSNEVTPGLRQSTGANGTTTFKMAKGLSNKTIKYVLRQTVRAPGYEWHGEGEGIDIEVYVTYDEYGVIDINTAPNCTQSEIAIIKNVNVKDALVEINIENEPIKELGVHVLAVNKYNEDEKIDGVKINAFLTETSIAFSYNSDGKYDLGLQEKQIETGADRNGDGVSDYGIGEDYQALGEYTEGAGTRLLRLIIQEVPEGWQNYNNPNGETIPSSQNIAVLLRLTFNDEGKVIGVDTLGSPDPNVPTSYRNGYLDGLGWLQRYGMVDAKPNGGYGVNVTLRFYPTLLMNLYSEDMYTGDELNASLKISTSTYPLGYLSTNGDTIMEGWVGQGAYQTYTGVYTPHEMGSVYARGNTAKGTFVNFARAENNRRRAFYIYENSEPSGYITGYQRYVTRNEITYYYQRRIAKIIVEYDEYGYIVGEPMVEYISSGNNMQDKNQVIETQVVGKNKLEVRVNYVPRTRVKINAIDTATGNTIGGVQITARNSLYNYRDYNYAYTSGSGYINWTHWGANIAGTSDKVFTYGVSFQNRDYYNTFFGVKDVSIQVEYNEFGRIAKGTVLSKNNYEGPVSINSGGRIFSNLNYTINNGTRDYDSTDSNAGISWNSDANELVITVFLERKFNLAIINYDMYDKTVTLNNQFEITPVAYDNVQHLGVPVTKVWADKRYVTIDRIESGKTYLYEINQITEENQSSKKKNFYNTIENMKLYVKFNDNGTIDSAWTDPVTSRYLTVISKDNGQLYIALNSAPTYCFDIYVHDEFYKSLGLEGASFTVVNDKNETGRGSLSQQVGIVSNEYGTAISYIGEVYPNETVKYTITQTNVVDRYKDNRSSIINYYIKFDDHGYQKAYSYDGVNFTDSYVKDRYQLIDISNTPKYVNIAIRCMDSVTKEGLNNIIYEITATDDALHGGNTDVKTFTTKIIEDKEGSIVEIVDDVERSSDFRTVTYIIKQLTKLNGYRAVPDIELKVIYNSDGSIFSYELDPNGKIYNDKLINVEVKIKNSNINKVNGIPVHIDVEVLNDDKFDLVVTDEDKYYQGLGVEGTKYQVSIGGNPQEEKITNSNGNVAYVDQKGNGVIEINIDEQQAGSGYRTNDSNKILFRIIKGEINYTIDLDEDELSSRCRILNKYVDQITGIEQYEVEIDNEKQVNAFIDIDEAKGIVKVTFKNETKQQITLLKHDINTNDVIPDALFEISRQEVNSSGNIIGDIEYLTPRIAREETDEEGNPVTVFDERGQKTDINGIIDFDLGRTIPSKKYLYTFEEVEIPEGYGELIKAQVYVEYDMYGQLVILNKEDSDNTTANWRLQPKYNPDNKNGLLAFLSNGYIPKDNPYKVKIVTEDSLTNKRINGVEFTVVANSRIGAQTTTLFELENNVTQDRKIGGLVLEKGVLETPKIGTVGHIEISIDEERPLDGYVPGFSNKTNGTIYLESYLTVQQELMMREDTDPNGLPGFGKFDVTIDNVNKQIVVKIKNDPVLEFNITKIGKSYSTDEENSVIVVETPLEGVDFDITSQIIEGKNEIETDLLQTTSKTNQEGLINEKVGAPYAGKTLIYNLHENSLPKYDPIDDIQIAVKFDSSGNVKYTELLSNSDDAKVIKNETSKKAIDLEVYNMESVTEETYNVIILKTDTDTGEPLEGVKFSIKVEEEYGQTREWIDYTDVDGKIISPEFSGYGTVTVTYTELDAPEGYILKAQSKKAIAKRNRTTKQWSTTHIDFNFDEGQKDFVIKANNELQNGRYNILMNKLDQRTNSIISESPAKFNVYYIEYQTKEEQEVDEEGNLVTKIVENEIMHPLGEQNTYNGKINYKALVMPEEGTYTYVFKEIDAPQGYVADEEEFRIDVTYSINEETGEKEISEIKNVSNSSLRGKIEILKTRGKNNCIAINIKNTTLEDAIKDDEFSLDITKVDGETGEPIPATIVNPETQNITLNKAVFKVKLPDVLETTLYAETEDTYLGEGKVDYCYIEQDKDYSVRLSHMKLPEIDENTVLPIEYEYVFKEVIAPEGYSLINEELILKVKFDINNDTGLLEIIDATSSNDKYMRIIKNDDGTIGPKRVSVEILNGHELQNEYKISFDKNTTDEVSNMPNYSFKHLGVDFEIPKETDKIPVREGYLFAGWAYESNATEAVLQPGDLYKADKQITLYAVWTKTIIEFNPNTTDEVLNMPNDIKDKEPNIDYILPNNVPERENYIFLGWSLTDPSTLGDNDELTVDYEPSELFEKDGKVVLYAVWQEKLFLKSDKYIIGDIPQGYTRGDTTEYKDGDVYIRGILPYVKRWHENQSYKQTVLDNIEHNADKVEIYDAYDNAITESTLVATNMKLKLTKGKQEITLIIVVIGDVTNGKTEYIQGDGKLNASDISFIRKLSIIRNLDITKDVFTLATDVVDYDGLLKASDISAFNAYSIGNKLIGIKSYYCEEEN